MITTLVTDGPRLPLDCPECRGSGFAHPCPECHASTAEEADPACGTCLGLGGFGSCLSCAGTGSTAATDEEREEMIALDTAQAARAH